MNCSRPVRFAAAVTLALSLVATSALTATSNPVEPPRTRSAAEGAPAQSTQSAPPAATRAAAIGTSGRGRHRPGRGPRRAAADAQVLSVPAVAADVPA